MTAASPKQALVSFPSLSFTQPELTIERQADGLFLHGSCDVSGVMALTNALRRMERRDRRFDVNLSAVHFADTTGLAPIAESVRRCRHLRRADLRLVAPSAAVSRILVALGVSVEPFGLSAWDAADRESIGATRPADTAAPNHSRAQRSVTPGHSRTLATYVTTAHQCGRCARIRVRGILDRAAALVVVELLLDHSAAGRATLTVDVSGTDRVDRAALDVLTRASRSTTFRLDRTVPASDLNDG